MKIMDYAFIGLTYRPKAGGRPLYAFPQKHFRGQTDLPPHQIREKKIGFKKV